MQTIDYVRTSRWIVNQYSTEVKDAVLGGGVDLHPSSDEGKRASSIIIRGATELAIVAERLNNHPHAPAVLQAFGLEALLDRGYAISLAESAAKLENPDKEPGPRDTIMLLRRVTRFWRVFEASIDPVEKLVIPDAVTQETDFDDVLTLELVYESGRYPKADTVAAVLQNASLLYAALARGLGQHEYPPLLVVYADSGSDLRLDFTGLGEPIKEVKNFLVELWNRLRHRRAEDYRANADALLGGLRAVAALDLLRQQGTLNDEDAARYRRDILESGIRLFEAGTLPREIQRVEPVNNERILADIQRKLLPPAPEAHQESSVKRTRRSRPSKKR